MLSTALLTLGHGTMRLPVPRSAGAGDSMWFSQGCSIGCECDEENGFLRTFMPVDLCKSGAQPTLPEKYRTFADIMKGTPKFADFTEYRPWRSPGSAMPLDSCGLAGGSTKNNDVAGGRGKDTIVHKQGFNGTSLPPSAAPAKWVAGEAVEVSWEIAANHGGGYVYRLCPATENLTEACFEKTVLPFASANSTLRWRNGKEASFEAMRTSEGTYPKGSVWTRNPIPVCHDKQAGFKGKGCDKGPAFPPPPGCDETCWGYQPCFPGEFPTGCPNPAIKTIEIPQIVDKVLVPKELKPGKYVVGFRWDCEHTAQVWSQCGDVEIVAPEDMVEA